MNTNRTRIHPALLAAATSVLAAAIAIAAHVVFGIGETPLVIGTLVVASAIGWSNTSAVDRPRVAPIDGGHGHHEVLHAA